MTWLNTAARLITQDLKANRWSNDLPFCIWCHNNTRTGRHRWNCRLIRFYRHRIIHR